MATPTVKDFYEALQEGTVDIVRAWLDAKLDIEQRFSIKECNAWNETPLNVASMWGHVTLLEMLLNERDVKPSTLAASILSCSRR